MAKSVNLNDDTYTKTTKKLRAKAMRVSDKRKFNHRCYAHCSKELIGEIVRNFISSEVKYAMQKRSESQDHRITVNHLRPL